MPQTDELRTIYNQDMKWGKEVYRYAQFPISSPAPSFPFHAPRQPSLYPPRS